MRARNYFKGLRGLGDANQTYTVKAGDSLSDIANTFYGDYTLYTYLAAVNNIQNANVIYPGQVLIIPPDPTTQANDSSSNDAINSVVPANQAQSQPTASAAAKPAAAKPAATPATTTSTNTILIYLGGSILLGVAAYFGYKAIKGKKK